MRALVTGGVGFIGATLVRALSVRGWEVVVLDNLLPQVHGLGASFPEFGPRVRTVYADIRDRGLMNETLSGGIDAVFHLAAMTGVGQSMYQIEEYLDINCRGTAVLLDAIAAASRRPSKLILSSSRAVYGEGRQQCRECRHEFFPTSRNPAALARQQWEHLCPACGAEASALPSVETSLANPTSIYGLTKKTQEQTCEIIARAYGIPCVVLRYFNVYGPGQSTTNPYTGILSIFSRRLLAGQYVDVYEDGCELRDFLHVDDVVQANLLAVATPDSGTYNICSGHTTSVYEVAGLLAKLIGRPDDCVRITGSYRIGDIRHGIGSWRKAEEELGFRAKTELKTGLISLIEWISGQAIDPTLDIDRVARVELETRGLLR